MFKNLIIFTNIWKSNPIIQTFTKKCDDKLEFNERITKLIVSTVLVLLLFGPLNLVLTQQSNTIIEESPLSAGIVDINIIDLGTLPYGVFSEARDINNLGEIIGESDGKACYWSIERVIQGVAPIKADSIKLSEINDLSQFVGFYDPQDDPIVLPPGSLPPAIDEYRPFFWTPIDGMISLGELDEHEGEITDINDLGQVVGWTYMFTETNTKRAFLWNSDGVTIDLGTLGGDYACPVDINNLGQVVGWAETLTGEVHNFLWTPENGMTDLGTLGYGYCFVNGINDQGYIIGAVADAPKDPYHAFLWTRENGIELLAPITSYSSEATGINNLGQIVGYYYINEYIKTHCYAFLWTPEDGFIDLGTLGGDYSVAWAINDVGQIVGSSASEIYFRHAVIWELPQQTTGIIISVIENLVEEGELNAGQATGLTAKLESAISLMNKGKLIPARNLLQAFINQINGLIATGALSQEEGEPLINYALELLNMITE